MQAVFSLQSILSAEWRAKMKSLNLTTLTIAVIGAINWGLIGLLALTSSHGCLVICLGSQELYIFL